ncbi:MAG: hypothetical protein GX020_07050 [Firmicutes bacterium]|nr:hypothetical protein [Bacillota bacterium]
MTKKLTIGTVVVNAVIILGLVVMFVIGYNENKVLLTDETVQITGFYGYEFSFSDVEMIELREELPGIQRRVNGMSFLGVHKGIYNLAEYGRSRLYIHGSTEPTIYVKADGNNIFIRFREPEKTTKLYEDILAAILSTKEE